MKNKNIKHCLALATLASASINVYSQQLESGYFIDNYTYAFRLNPAFGLDNNFVAMPALGSLNIGARGSLDLKDVIYNVDGKTTTFLNPGVPVSEVLDNIPDKGKIGADVRVGILAGGFKAWGGYNTVSISARAKADIMVPKALFSLLKEGVSNQTYDISDVYARANAFAEIAFGHSRDINNRLRVGGTLKFMIGGGAIDARLEQADLSLGTDEWTITSDATIKTNLSGYRYKTTTNDNTGHRYVNGLDGSFNGLNGFGMALDLGAVYQLNQDWTFSAAILDFGFMSYSDTQLASTGGPKTFNTDKYIFSADDNAENSFDNEWHRMRDDLSALYELEDMGSTGARATMPEATINLGAAYNLPVYRGLTFGILSSTRLAGKFTTSDVRISASVAPCKVFSAGINMVAGTYGVGFGWIANVHTTGFNMFLGMDRTLGKISKNPGIPVTSNADVSIGINFPF